MRLIPRIGTTSNLEQLMKPFFLLMFPLVFLGACWEQEENPININNENVNILTVESGCCCGDPCAIEEDTPCDPDDEDTGDTDDTGDFGDTGIETVDFEEVDTERLELEVNHVDVAFLLDTTGSMTSTAVSMATEFDQIVDDLSFTIVDGAYGFATYDDYNYEPYGAGADLPFILQQQVTTDQSLVQTELDVIDIHHGGDSPESGMEALFQGLTGEGYDQNGNATFDSGTDVLPFIHDAGDVFNGSATGTYDGAVVGGGSNGGFGFRDGSLPVIVYATDNYLRDPDSGYGAPVGAAYNAGASDVVDAATALGARLIGIGANSSLAVPQMTDLAIATDSLYEADGDSLIDDPLVFTWSGSSSAFRDTIVEAIEGMLDGVTFATVTAQVTGNTYGFATNIAPASYSNVTVGTSPVVLAFEVAISGTVPASTIDQTFPLTLEIYGDGSTLLGTRDVSVVVPASL
jgi:hypothetical protein